MPDPQEPSSSHATLSASYSAPNGDKRLEQRLKALPENYTTAQKTAYLAGLRTATVKMRDEINRLLTAKMEEDKAAAGNGKTGVNDVKEEENYGEEVVEE